MSAPSEDFMAPMEVEHAMGFSGRSVHTLVYHPTDANTDVVVYPIGKLLVLADINDPHKQHVLRGHDAEVTAVDISRSGKFICSGQAPNMAGEAAGIIYVWDYMTRDPVYVLKGHSGTVLSCVFSDDDRWIASTGEDGKVCIWDMEVGQLAGGAAEYVNVNNRQLAKWAAWGPMENMNTRRPKYTVCVGYEKEVRVCTWEFNIKTMAFGLTQAACTIPGSGGGLSRYYNCGCVSSDGRFCLAGTTSGDVVVYSVKNAAFSAVVPIASNVTCCMCVDASTFLVGTGDGGLKVVITSDGKDWQVIRELALVGGVTNITVSADKQEVVVGSNVGMVYRVLTSDMTFSVLMASHVATVRRAVFPHHRSDLFVTVGDDGYVRQWDLSSYGMTSSFTFNSNPHKINPSSIPLCASYQPDDALVMTGWNDGYLRCLDMSQQQATVAWQIINAHKGAINVITCASKYFCTAAEDCIIRVWAHQNREMLLQISEHKRPITGIIIDNTTEAIIHTISLDKYMYTYDVYKSEEGASKTAKRLTYHCDLEGLGFNGAAQRHDQEHEVIVGTLDGRLLTYDIDYQQPTLVVVDPLRTRINSVAISPSGTHMATGNSDGRLHLYDLRSSPPRLLGQAWLHCHEILCVAWSPDEKQLVTCGHDSALCVWNFYGNNE